MKIDRKELLGALLSLKPALGTGGVVVEFSHIWFDGSFVYACDGIFGIRKPFKTDFVGGVPGTPLLGLLNSSTVTDVVLERSGSDNLLVKLGKSTTKLVALSADRKIWSYPNKIPTGNTVVLPSEFLGGLRKILLVKVASPTRVEHQGVMVELKQGDRAELYCTDSSSVARVIVDGVRTQVTDIVFMLPRDFAEQLVMQAGEQVVLSVLDDYIVAELDDKTLYANVIDVSGADDLAVVVAHEENKHPKAVPIPEGLVGALKRSAILAGPEDPLVDFSVEEGGLKVAGSYKLGVLQELLTLEGEHPDVFSRVRVRAVQRALDCAQTFSISRNSLLLKGEGNFSYVVASML